MLMIASETRLKLLKGGELWWDVGGAFECSISSRDEKGLVSSSDPVLVALLP